MTALPGRDRWNLAWLPGILLLAYGLLALGYLLQLSWNAPLLDLFGFRQAQTAISVYWMAKGGPLLAYQTPVLGYPWSIPFEFPIYQWLAALVASNGVLTVDQSGRVIGVAFFLASAALVHRISLRLWSDRALALACAGAFLASPMALFWARSVLIESTALFFSLAFLWALLEFHLRRRPAHALAAVVLATLAALVKITTFYGFAVPLALLLLVLLLRHAGKPSLKAVWQTSLVAAGAVLVAMLALFAWLWFSDIAKAQSPLGDLIATAKLAPFTYGTLAQRLDPVSWQTIIFGRAVYDVLGSGWILLASAIILAFNASLRWLALLLLFGYLLPFLTFTNLHYKHSYYQFENFAFLTALVGLAIASLARRGKAGALAATAAAAVVIGFSVIVLKGFFIPLIVADQSERPFLEIARYVREHSRDNDVMLVFGMDWSSEIPYYATRRAIMVPDWTPHASLIRLLDPRAAFGPDPVGAVVVCPNTLAPPYSRMRPTYVAILAKYSGDFSSAQVGGCEVLTRQP
jgi:hypothetical protein